MMNFVGVETIADAVGITKHQVYEMCRKNIIAEAIKIGRIWYIPYPVNFLSDRRNYKRYTNIMAALKNVEFLPFPFRLGELGVD